jgi:hypothetical protein
MAKCGEVTCGKKAIDGYEMFVKDGTFDDPSRMSSQGIVSWCKDHEDSIGRLPKGAFDKWLTKGQLEKD